MQRVEMIPGRAGAQGQRNLSGQIPGWAGATGQGAVQGLRSLSWQIPGLVGAMAAPGWAGATSGAIYCKKGKVD